MCASSLVVPSAQVTQAPDTAPGVVEEAYVDATSKRKVPLLVAGGFGGAAALVAKAINKEIIEVDIAGPEAHFKALQRALKKTPRPVTFRQMIEALGPDAIADNGLGHDANRVLMSATDIDDIVAHCLIAVHNIATRPEHRKM